MITLYDKCLNVKFSELLHEKLLERDLQDLKILQVCERIDRYYRYSILREDKLFRWLSLISVLYITIQVDWECEKFAELAKQLQSKMPGYLT